MGKRRHHIAFFLLSLDGGGLERVVLNLAKAFAKEGHKVDIIAAKAVGAFVDQVPLGVNLVDLKASRVIACLPSLRKYLKANRPEVILGTGDFTNLLSVWATKLSGAGTRVIATEHVMYSFFLHGQKNLRDRLIPWLLKLTYPFTTGIVAVSAGLAAELSENLKLPRKNISVIHNPIVDDELIDKSNAQVQHPWLQRGQLPVIISVGRLVEAKDYPTLLRAFCLVNKACPARLMILGEGERRPELESLMRELGVADSVLLPGFVPNPYAYMKRAAIFVSSSKWESFGNVIVEALACGTQVVATDCPSGPKEILENGKFGKLVPVGDEKALASAIITALRQKVDPGPLQQRASDFSVENIAQEYLKVMFGN